MRLGVIDIGYNAIRAVVYEDSSLGSPEIFNNKFKNDILNLLSHEDINIKHQAYLSIQHIIHVFNNLNVEDIKCVATAVLREHPRAHEFANYIKTKFNFNMEIISGSREAYLTALGLISGINDANGIAADLGGGSLELVEVNNRKVGKLESFELGTKIINAKNLRDLDLITNIIKEKYNNQTYDNLYLIGGALRFIARFFIEFTNYPIKNLHNLEISSKDFSEYLDNIQSPATVKSKLGRKRINNNAVLVAKALITVFRPRNIIVSIFGLKEGVRFELLEQSEQEKNIIIEKVKYRCNYKEDNTDFASYLKIVEPLVTNKQDLDQILKLSMMLFSLNKYYDQTLPPKSISEYILSSEIPFTHRLRLMLALILSYTSNFKPDNNLLKIAKKLLSKVDYNNSQIIGHFLRIAIDIDGTNFTTPTFSIKLQNLYLEIDSKETLPRPIFEKVCERLKSIAFARKMNFN